jgi:hypothetical protein
MFFAIFFWRAPRASGRTKSSDGHWKDQSWSERSCAFVTALEEPAPTDRKLQTAALNVRAVTAALCSAKKLLPESTMAMQVRSQRKSSPTPQVSSCDISGGAKPNFSNNACTSA